MSITLYHNPRCSKSRQTLQLLKDNDHNPIIVEYLKTPPDAATLKQIILALGTDANGIMRTGEEDYKAEQERVAGLNEADKITWLCEHPKVIQRPIAVHGNRARIGRPPEDVLDIL
ncbi:MAG: arsenate reductase (glutaredoxin) [Chromatiales bacterium]|jgi:arsenate reductase (glutaredoxin)|nr:arsenate reductase (glutaredoxin) [Chromatiales bacterium]MDB4498071.1 arsenate reductase (glutaredoxin) [Gammaproteobacteria bacterium]